VPKNKRTDSYYLESKNRVLLRRAAEENAITTMAKNRTGRFTSGAAGYDRAIGARAFRPVPGRVWHVLMDRKSSARGPISDFFLSQSPSEAVVLIGMLCLEGMSRKRPRKVVPGFLDFDRLNQN